MAISYRVATDADFEAMCDFDGAQFGQRWEPAERLVLRPTLDLERFVLARDGADLVGVAGNFTQELTVPGGVVVPAAGVTWVAVATTHRRSGILTELMRRLHDQAIERDEPIAMLTASEGGIYERFGYGVASQRRVIEIDRRRTQLQERFRPEPGSVRFVDAGDD
ncbi:MAG: GNAT family N-acetyltransferase, partial [Actinomycetota bacterium]